MCGHVGYMSSNPGKDNMAAFTQLLLIDQLRGRDSTGVIGIKENNDGSYFKRSLVSTDFIQLNTYQSWAKQEYKIVIGHNRAATKGVVNDENSHPFIEDKVILAHNGTLTNHRTMKHGMKQTEINAYDVDSQAIAGAINNISTYKGKIELIESMMGAYALVWIDRRDDSLNFARNKDRDFWFAETEEGIFWASEKEMLTLILARRDIEVTNYINLAVGEWVQFNINDLDAKPKIRKFTPRASYSSQNWNNYGTGSNYANGNTNINRAHLSSPNTSHPTITMMDKSQDGYEKDDYVNVIPLEIKSLTSSRNFALSAMAIGTGALFEVWLPKSLRREVERLCNKQENESVCYRVKIGRIKSTQEWRKGKLIKSELIYGNVEHKKDRMYPTKPEERCETCNTPIYTGTEIERHHGKVHHVACLDALDGVIQQQLLAVH